MAFCGVEWRAMKKDISLYYITLHIYTKRAFCLFNLLFMPAGEKTVRKFGIIKPTRPMEYARAENQPAWKANRKPARIARNYSKRANSGAARVSCSAILPMVFSTKQAHGSAIECLAERKTALLSHNRI